MKAFINCLSYYLPSELLTNQDLVDKYPEWNIKKITDKIGVNQRHISGSDETSGDMAVKAANKLFKDFKINPNSIDFILFCSQSPDYLLPTTACLIQDKLGIPSTVGAIDFNLGCSGYVYGLSLAKGLIFGGIARNVLLLTADTYTKYIHHNDKGNQSIFGDGASATLIKSEGFAEIGNFVLGTDGKGANNLIIKNGGSRNPTFKNENNRENVFLNSPDHLYMNGSEVFNFTLEAVPTLVKSTLEKNNLEKDQVDLFVFHQANTFMLNTLMKVCDIRKDRFHIDMEDIGNTVSSTIPIALARIQDRKGFEDLKKILLAGFGVGYSWGGCILHLK